MKVSSKLSLGLPSLCTGSGAATFTRYWCYRNAFWKCFLWPWPLNEWPWKHITSWPGYRKYLCKFCSVPSMVQEWPCSEDFHGRYWLPLTFEPVTYWVLSVVRVMWTCWWLLISGFSVIVIEIQEIIMNGKNRSHMQGTACLGGSSIKS